VPHDKRAKTINALAVASILEIVRHFMKWMQKLKRQTVKYNLGKKTPADAGAFDN
jgi:hypothetical protein